MAFETFDRGVFPGQCEFRVSVMLKVELLDCPARGLGVAPCASQLELPAVRVLMAIRAFRPQALELGGGK